MTDYALLAFVGNAGDPQGTAQRLLEAADAAGYPPDVVRVAPGLDGWYVPEDLGDGTPADWGVFVPGDDRATARSLLEAADAASLPPSVVRVAAGFRGFVVPEELAPAGPALDLVITEPTDGAEVDPLAAIRGTGALAGSTVDLYMDSSDDGQVPVSSVTADGSGAFEFAGSTPLEVSPEHIAVGVGDERSSKVTVTIAPAETTTTKKGKAG
jgi:hypothetical protein